MLQTCCNDKSTAIGHIGTVPHRGTSYTLLVRVATFNSDHRHVYIHLQCTVRLVVLVALPRRLEDTHSYTPASLGLVTFRSRTPVTSPSPSVVSSRGDTIVSMVTFSLAVTSSPLKNHMMVGRGSPAEKQKIRTGSGETLTWSSEMLPTSGVTRRRRRRRRKGQSQKFY